MGTKPLVGGSTYNRALTDLRNAAEAQRHLLDKLMGSDVGPNHRTALLAKLVWQLSAMYSAIGELERIGQQAKAERKDDDDES